MITVKEMRALERFAQKKGIFPIHLMENAGKQVYAIIKEGYGLLGKHIVVFAGAGNNGGDGFVAARHFAEECRVVVLFFGEEENLTEEAQENYDKIKDKINIISIATKEDLEQFHIQDDLPLILVDALLGTGVNGKIREPVSLGIEYFNSLNGIKVAVDIPSGLNADTGVIEDKACNADLIITFHDLKMGLENYKEKTVVVDIGIPVK